MTDNPYQPATIQAPSPSGRPSNWRFLPAAFFLLLGLMFIGFAVAIIVASIAFAATENEPMPGGFYLGATAWLTAGIVWLVSSVLFWMAKYRKGVYTALAAFAVIAIHAALGI